MALYSVKKTEWVRVQTNGFRHPVRLLRRKISNLLFILTTFNDSVVHFPPKIDTVIN